MRQVNAVIAGRVIPATVHVYRARSVGQRKMPIGAIYVAAGALAFKVEDNVGQRRPLQQIVVNLEAAGTDDAISGRDAQDVMPRRAECRKIRLPVSTIAPAIHVTRR